MTRPTAQQSIEASLTARVSVIDAALADQRRDRAALDNARQRIRQWITDGQVEWTDLAELLADMEAS